MARARPADLVLSMSAASPIVGLIFLIFGGWLLLWRLIHMCLLGEFWNNMPSWLSWTATSVITGFTILATAALTAAETCPDGCKLEHDDNRAGWLVTGLLVMIPVSLGIWFCGGACCGYNKDEDPDDFTWGDEYHKPSDHRIKYSGYDIAAISMGLVVLLVTNSIGECPKSCGEAVVIPLR